MIWTAEWGRWLSSMRTAWEKRWQGLPVVAGFDDMLEYTKKDVVDEVFIHVSLRYGTLLKAVYRGV